MKYSALGIAAALFIGLLPLIATDHLFYGSVNGKFLFSILAIDALLFWSAFSLWNSAKKPSLFGLVGPALILVFMVGVLSSLFGVHPEHSFWSDILRSTGLVFLAHIGALAFLLGNALQKDDFILVRRAIVLSGGAVALLSILGKEGFGLSGEFLTVNLDIIGLTFGNSTFAGAYLALALVFGLIEVAHAPKKSTWRIAAVVSSLLMLFSPLLFNTGLLIGRIPFAEVLANPLTLLGSARASSAVAFAFTGFFLLTLLGRAHLPAQVRRPIFLGTVGVILSSIAISLLLLFTPGSVVQNAYIDASTPARIFVWEGSFKAFTERPLLGWGPENFSYAHESHLDSRLFLKENIAEIWFDKAHNAIIDTLVGWGALGVLAFALLTLACILVPLRALLRKRIEFPEALALASLPLINIIQLQTAFDTTGSYALLGVFAGYLIYLERQDGAPLLSFEGKLWRKGSALVVGALAFVSIFTVFFEEWQRQDALFTTFATRDASIRFESVKKSLTRASDLETLRLSSASYIKTMLVGLEGLDNPEEAGAIAVPFLQEYERAYKAYLEASPSRYRARMNYAYLLLTQRILGINRIEEARAIIRDSYALSPGNPITYSLDALASLYEGDIAEAKRIIKEGIAVAPEVELPHAVLAYLERQEKNFPSITFLNMENL